MTKTKTKEEWRKIEDRSVNLYYKKYLKKYMEDTSGAKRDHQIYQEDLLRICVNHELDADNRIHIMLHAWYEIQRMMIRAGMVSVYVFEGSLPSDMFAIRDEYFSYLMKCYDNDLVKIYNDVKPFPRTKQWFENLVLDMPGCPLEILKMKYTNIP